MEEIKQGDCLRLTSFEYVSERGTRLRFKMPRDQVLLAVVVGDEVKLPTNPNEVVDVKEAMTNVMEGSREVMPAELTKVTGRARI